MKESDRKYTISFVGAGNIAFRMALFLQKAGHDIRCICNRTLENAEKVTRALKKNRSNVFATTKYEDIPPCDLLIIAVSDSYIEEVAQQLPDKGQFTVHTCGASPMEVLHRAGFAHYGVLYPLMTISKNREIDERLIPFLLEAGDEAHLDMLKDIINSLKAEYMVCDSDKRLRLHATAVFTTNFINYMLTLAYDLNPQEYVFFLPSAVESVRKAFLKSPLVSQTGPAKRGDLVTLEKHMKVLEEAGMQDQLEVYRMLSEKIMKRFKDK